MRSTSARTVRATASLIGTIIGAGIFGVPFVVSRVGIIPAVVYLVLLTLLVLVAHLGFAEVVLAVRSAHRLPGFAKDILGPAWGHFAMVLSTFGNWLALTAYIILGGTFLATLFGGSIGGWGIVFLAACVVAAYAGLRWVSRIEIPLAALLVALLVIIAGAALPHTSLLNLNPLIPASPLLPYGVILFALTGFPVIPEMEDIVGNGNRVLLRRSVVLGTVIAAVVVAFFGIAIAAATGPSTSADALSGLAPVLGHAVILVGAVAGLLAVASSCLIVLTNQVDTFSIDHHVRRPLAWIYTIVVPLFFFGAVGANFIRVLGLAGGLIGGITAALVMLMLIRLHHRRKTDLVHHALPYLAGTLFLGGAVLAIMQFVS